MEMGEDKSRKKPGYALLEWYDSHRRDLPWREDPTPYHVWISEIMLQQTRVETVRGYYTRFLQRFPDVRSLAEAEEDDCLKLWEGLGYYSRARNLKKAAGQIMSLYGGEMPRKASELRKLSGIGPYTSAAIASIAFGEKIPAVDGNLLRIFPASPCMKSRSARRLQLKPLTAFFSGSCPTTDRGISIRR